MKPELVLRWMARIWGLASALLLFAFAFGGREHLRFTAGEAVAFLLFPVGVVVGFGIAWWRELSGALITMGSLALFFMVSVALGKPLSPYFLLFAAPGFLHLASALLGGAQARSGNRVS
ncbi:MAG: hypothetical protein JNL10_10590 [Verrucomicrobiales bacterium]|nr:hypothetical protein [Verrucomicrobiales bacterium]